MSCTLVRVANDSLTSVGLGRDIELDAVALSGKYTITSVHSLSQGDCGS